MSYQAALEHSVRQTGVFRCLECGKCTAICPISRYDHHFSPRRTVGRALMRHDEALLSDDRLWACITCLHCSQVCPAGVAYSDLTLAVRTAAHKLGQAAVCTHGEAIHSWMRLMLAPGLKQNRLDWLAREQVGEFASGQVQNHESRITNYELRITNHELRISDSSDTLYFVGCAPYFDVQFGHIGVDGSGVARATVQVLNAIGIEPQVLADEVCCGHDLLWEGDEDTFRELAALNATLIRQSGAKRIVTACPECARALKMDYPAHGVKLDAEILHLAELLANTESPIPNTRIPNTQYPITYQDPCRLGRHLGVYDAPRQVIAGLGLELVEMPRHREDALCCGTNGWTHCGAANKEIQADRLREAQATGAGVLVTACLKCQIHFKCALQDRQFGKELAIEIKDLATLVAESLS
jgi:Fe-S oxidoreductase